MRMHILAIWLWGLGTMVMAEPDPALTETLGVEDAIPAAVKALGEPTAMDFPGGMQMAVSAAEESVQKSVLQGINHLHGGWNFEASRHFAAAMRKDPECLLAHWGMVMSLITPTPETGAARNAAALRLADLVDQGKGTKLERGYAYGLIKYLEAGPVAAANAFAKVAAEFPNEMLSRLYAGLFGRTGYDDDGAPKEEQQRVENDLEQLMKTHPGSLIPLYTLLMTKADGGNLRPSLHLARRLCELSPNYPPFQHLLGHYAWRCGEHGEAAAAFGRATNLYEKWMQQEKATVADCPEWTRAECYRVVALSSLGDFDAALDAAKNLATTALPPGREKSEGVRCLLWEAKTLPARLIMARGDAGDTARAMAALPPPATIKPYHENSLAHWWIDGLRMVLDTRRLVETDKTEDARKGIAALDYHGTQMAKAQKLSFQTGERSEWNRFFRAFETLVCETRGIMAEAGPKKTRGAAYNWFRSAADAQSRPTMMLPPVVLTPQLARAGRVLLAEEKAEDAREIFERTLELYPDDLGTLDGLRQALEALGKNDEAAAIADKIARKRKEPAAPEPSEVK